MDKLNKCMYECFIDHVARDSSVLDVMLSVKNFLLSGRENFKIQVILQNKHPPRVSDYIHKNF